MPHPIVYLDHIPYAPDLPALLTRLRLAADSDEAAEVGAMLAAARALARPQAACARVYITGRSDHTVQLGDQLFTSRVLAVNLLDTYRAFPFAAISGAALGAWATRFTEPLTQYWAAAILDTAVSAATAALRARLAQDYAPAPTVAMNPGTLDDWPLSAHPGLLALLGDAAAAMGLVVGPTGALGPVKAVAGLYFASHIDFDHCRLCDRPHCDARRVPYDAALYARQYAVPAVWAGLLRQPGSGGAIDPQPAAPASPTA